MAAVRSAAMLAELDFSSARNCVTAAFIAAWSSWTVARSAYTLAGSVAAGGVGVVVVCAITGTAARNAANAKARFMRISWEN